MALLSDFYCTQCGNKGIPCWRKNGHKREVGHLKKLWCPSCGKETNCVECASDSRYTYEIFLKEFESNNFNEQGQRIKPYKEIIKE